MNWMSWINSIFLLLMLNAVLGCAGYRIWTHIRWRFEAKAAYQTIYQMHKLVMGLFLFPSILLVLLCPGIRQIFYRELFLDSIAGEILELILFAFFIFWLAGMLHMLIRTCCRRSAFKDMEKYNTDLKENVLPILNTICTRHQYYHMIRLAENPFVPVPMISGAARRMILLPEDTYDMQELEMILEHELVHAKKHDLVYKQAALITRIVFWFVPDVFRQEQDLDEWCETCCDIEMCGRSNSVWKKKQYFQVLVKRAQEIQEQEVNVCYALCGDMNAICRRMNRMKQYAMAVEEKRIRVIGSVLVSLALILLCGAGSIHLGKSLCGLYVEKQFAVSSEERPLAKGSKVCAGSNHVLGHFTANEDEFLNLYINLSDNMTAQMKQADLWIGVYDEQGRIALHTEVTSDSSCFAVSVKQEETYYIELQNGSGTAVKVDYMVIR